MSSLPISCPTAKRAASRRTPTLAIGAACTAALGRASDFSYCQPISISACTLSMRRLLLSCRWLITINQACRKTRRCVYVCVYVCVCVCMCVNNLLLLLLFVVLFELFFNIACNGLARCDGHTHRMQVQSIVHIIDHFC